MLPVYGLAGLFSFTILPWSGIFTLCPFTCSFVRLASAPSPVLMSEATIPLVDAKSLLTLFGTRDQHLRKIRDSLGVSVSSRHDRIHIEGR